MKKIDIQDAAILSLIACCYKILNKNQIKKYIENIKSANKKECLRIIKDLKIILKNDAIKIKNYRKTFGIYKKEK